MEGRVVACESVIGEIRRGVTPHSVNMVDISLSVVVFGKQSRSLQPVVVRLAALDTASPREVHGIELATLELLGLPFGEFLWDSADEDVENRSK
jgi:hypothetical protein